MSIAVVVLLPTHPDRPLNSIHFAPGERPLIHRVTEAATIRSQVSVDNQRANVTSQ
jgi:hypothetical protein